MLKLQFLPDGSQDCPLICISGADLTAFKLLRDAIEQLSNGTIRETSIDRFPGIVAVEDCRVSAIATTWDQGVIKLGETNTFEWRLTPDTWDNVAGLLEPFCRDNSRPGFQWLESAGDVRVLATSTGEW